MTGACSPPRPVLSIWLRSDRRISEFVALVGGGASAAHLPQANRFLRKLGLSQRAAQTNVPTRTTTIAGARPNSPDDRLYRLTAQGRLHALGGRDPQEQWARPWDGRWRLVLFDVPTGQNPQSDGEIVAGAWDFERINRRYVRHLNVLEERPVGALRNDAAAKSLLRWAAAEREAW